jgi:hypothetical protein
MDIHFRIKTNVKEEVVSWTRRAALAWGDDNLQVVKETIAQRTENSLGSEVEKENREHVKQTWLLILNKEKN